MHKQVQLALLIRSVSTEVSTSAILVKTLKHLRTGTLTKVKVAI